MSIFRATNALTPLATPTPPRRSAISPTIDRKLLSRSIARVRPRSTSATVRGRTLCGRNCVRSGRTHCSALVASGSFTTASYSARLPKTSSCVSAR